MREQVRLLSFLLFATAGLSLYAAGQGVPAEELTAPLKKAVVPELVAQNSALDEKAIISGFSLVSELVPNIRYPQEPIRLEAGASDVVLFFDVDSKDTSPREFRYRLSGYDFDWTITRSRTAHYRRLTPGHYRFEVGVHEPGQPWSIATASLAVEQKPFFYQTWYFYLLVLLGLVILAAQLLRQRDQLLKGQMGMVLEERNRIASDCHDTLMAGLAAIAWQLEATANLIREPDAISVDVTQSCELARSMVSHCQSEARRIIWNLRDSDELTNVLSHALSRAITMHRHQDRIETTLEVEGEEVAIVPVAVHHLVCIGQEAITNAIRHAKPSTIRIYLRYEHDSLSLAIRDNGRGFVLHEAARRTGHFGIPVMEERARKLGGTLRLVTSAGAGTEVAIRVSFNAMNLPTYRQHYVVPWIGV